MELNFKLIEDAIPLLLAGAGITLEITAMSVGFGLLMQGLPALNRCVMQLTFM